MTTTLWPDLVQDVGEMLLRFADTDPVSRGGARGAATLLNVLRFVRGLHQELFDAAEARLVEGVEAGTFVAEFASYIEVLGRFVARFGKSVEALSGTDSTEANRAELEKESRDLWEQARRQYDRLSSVLDAAKAAPPPGFWHRAREASLAGDKSAYRRFDSAEEMMQAHPGPAE